MIRNSFWILVVAALLSLVGCDTRGGLSQQDYDRAKDALDQALTAWQKGEPAKKWFATNASVRFVDDEWGKGNRLMKYEIVHIRANADGYPEAIVRLTIQQKKGNQQMEQEALYGINVKKANQVIIGRDPMY